MLLLLDRPFIYVVTVVVVSYHPLNDSFDLFVPEQNLGSRRDPPQINRLPKWSLSGKKIGRHIPKGPELLTFHFSHVLNKAKSISLRKNLPEN